ncbi:TPA: DUF1801 domain-containing protein [bacterium]|nr:DUF1801 domain-containing protein [bacterium]
MKNEIKTPEEYIEQLLEDRKVPIIKLREIIKECFKDDLEEIISYGMLSYVVPYRIYPKGYHVNKQPLPFISIASQKNHIAFYHMGVYMFPEVLSWFVEEYPKYVSTKLDMGKGCIRFKNPKNIPYNLIKQLCEKILVSNYIIKYDEII